MRLSHHLHPHRTHSVLTLAALLLAIAPAISTLGAAWPSRVVVSSSAHPLAEPLHELNRLAQQQRRMAALQFELQLPATAPSLADLQRARTNALHRVRHLGHLLPTQVTAELLAIQAEWAALDADMSHGRLSAAASFARHTQLLDRQLGLQATLRDLAG